MFFVSLTFYCVSFFFLFPVFLKKRRDFSVMNSGPVLYLIYLIFATTKKRKKKKVFIIVEIYLHLVVLGKRGSGFLFILTTLATKWDEVVRREWKSI